MSVWRDAFSNNWMHIHSWKSSTDCRCVSVYPVPIKCYCYLSKQCGHPKHGCWIAAKICRRQRILQQRVNTLTHMHTISTQSHIRFLATHQVDNINLTWVILCNEPASYLHNSVKFSFSLVHTSCLVSTLSNCPLTLLC